MGNKTCLKPLVVAIASILTLTPHVLKAQALEEIVVTAQRRTQTLQEVPISVEAISAAEISRQGYRDLSALSAFSPTVNVDQESVIGPTISIRGFGTSGNAVTLESATPIFVDGIHFSRMSMMKTAFMDPEQVEVLKGPQPVYFGQNAIAGAFNIQSRKPSDVWEGNVDAEYGNRDTMEVNGGVGGPINDQWRVRLAGKYEDAGGYLNDVMTGRDLGGFDALGGRVTLQWLPSEQLTATYKLDYGRIRKDVEAVHICRTPGSTIYGRNGPVDEPFSAGFTIGQEDSVFGEPPVQGEGWNTPLQIPLDADCFGSRNGISAGGPYNQPPDTIREENSDFGSLDVREAAEGFASIDNRGIAGYEDLDTLTSSLKFDYEFANGVMADWNTGYVRYLRNYVRDNSYSTFFMNFQGREEDYDQWSSEVRFNSPSGGTIEWTVSAFYQTGDLDVFSSSLRANLRTPQRFNDVWEDQEWFAGSGVLTFNFLDDKASIDVGGRMAKLNKSTYAEGYSATWVYDVRPCDPDLLGTNGPVKNEPTAAAIAACNAANADIPEGAVPVSATQTRILVDGPVNLGNLWTFLYDFSGTGSDRREISPSWLPSQARAVGLTNPDYATRARLEGRTGPLFGEFDNSEFDPQVTLRYRPTEDISVYGRWAQSSKAGGFDTGQTSLSPDGYEFAPEFAETFEVGAKGSYMDGRGRFDATLFTLEFTDLQISVATSDPDNPFVNLNAGSQRVRGLEFGNQFAVSDQLVLGLGGAILDGEFTNFPNSTCTIIENREAATGPCISAAEAVALGNAALEDTIDRTGTKTPRTPDWKFIGDVDYWMPLLDQYKLSFNAKGYYSDGYTTDFEGFTETVRFDKHGDVNLTLGFGDQDDIWTLSVYGRNLLEASPTYHPEFDIDADGTIQTPVSPNYYSSYGIKFSYNYQ